MSEKICVVGLGYVGLPLSLILGSKFECIGFDVDACRVQNLKNGIDENGEHSSSEIFASNVQFYSALDEVQECSMYIVTVPTPVNSENIPDLSALKEACDGIGKIIKKENIIVFESTVFPGCTEDFCGPLLASQSNLIQSQDFYLGYSPERINPGDKVNSIKSITKVVAGDNAQTLDRIASVYGAVIDAGLHEASSIRIAEAAKLTENIQRDVNIALMNELSSVFHAMGIRTSEVLQAANTKWNFIPFRPGIVGGHCVGVDPYYLIESAKKQEIDTKLVTTARMVNESVVKRIFNYFTENVPQVHGRSLVMGLTFKEDCKDTRNSKALELANKLADITTVHAIEPNLETVEGANFELVESFCHAPYDCIILAVNHRQFANLPGSSLKTMVGNDGYIFDLQDSLKLDPDKSFYL